MDSIAQEPISPQDYQRFADRVQQALVPDLWRQLATQRRYDSPNTVGRRLIGAGYRALYGWAIAPAAFPRRHDDGTVGCSCWKGVNCPTPGKHPLGDHNSEVMPTAPALAWLVEALLEPGSRVGYDAGYDANLAALTGQRSDSLMVADVDPRHGGALTILLAAGWSPDTPIERTGGGGWHVFARWPFAGPVPTVSSYLTGVELKGDGALVIVSPSRHASGQHYAWLQGHAPWQSAIALLPDAVAQDILAHAPASSSGRATPAHRDDVDDHRALAYSPEKTVELATILLNWAVRKTRSAHRNDVAYQLGRQLKSLGLTNQEIAALATLYERTVRP